MIKSWFLAVCKYVPPIFLVLIPAMIIYGLSTQWIISKDVLSKYESSFILFVGFKKESGFVGGRTFERESRNYLIIGDNLQSKTVTIYAEFGELHKVKEEEGGLLTFIISYLLLIVVTWFFWLRPHNKSLQPTTNASAE
ncbi:hypothetical protein A9Q78_11770 [Methylophaga sp. 41_12_T18]|nr:hypothetical protein A9Q78_11770 [Methylophaga sp. 41_12_T18]